MKMPCCGQKITTELTTRQGYELDEIQSLADEAPLESLRDGKLELWADDTALADPIVITISNYKFCHMCGANLDGKKVSNPER